MGYHKFTEVYVYIIRYSCRILMKDDFSNFIFLNIYHYHFPILIAPLISPVNLQVPARILTFLQKVNMATQYYLLRVKKYTLCPLADTNVLNAFEYNAESRPFWISLMLCLITFLITSLQFISLHLQEKLKKANVRWSVKCSYNESGCLYVVCVKCHHQWIYKYLIAACLRLTYISSQIKRKKFSLLFS